MKTLQVEGPKKHLVGDLKKHLVGGLKKHLVGASFLLLQRQTLSS